MDLTWTLVRLSEARGRRTVTEERRCLRRSLSLCQPVTSSKMTMCFASGKKSSVLGSCSWYCCFGAAVEHVCFHFSLAEFMPQVKVELVETVEGCTHEVIGHIFPPTV